MVSSRIVLDASAAVDFLVDRGEKGVWATESIAAADAIVAPHVIDFEVLAALRRLLLTGKISEQLGAWAVDGFVGVRLRRYSAARLHGRIWTLRHDVCAHNAAYVALAEALEIPLVTTDARLARAKGHRAEILAYEA